MCLLAILLLVWGNLRGVRESGTLFAIPTYAFLVLFLVGYFTASALGVPDRDVAGVGALIAFGILCVLFRGSRDDVDDMP